MDIVVAPTIESIILESNKPDSIVIDTSFNALSVPEVYSIVVEIDTSSTIVAG